MISQRNIINKGSLLSQYFFSRYVENHIQGEITSCVLRYSVHVVLGCHTINLSDE